MANTIISPNMSLPVPVPGIDPGPDYATNDNLCFNIIDGHTHAPGSGIQITPDGLNINSDLDIKSHDLVNVSGVNFSVPASNTTPNRLYEAPQVGGGINDLFFNDGAGNVIAITKAGAVNATIASIPGESYAGGTFTWVQGNGSTTPANFDIGFITLRPNVAATTNGIQLQTPAGIASQYAIVLPALPSSKGLMNIDPSGNISVYPMPVPPAGSPGFIRLDNAGALTAAPIYDIVVGVGGDYALIQDAIDAASAGMSIYVLRGTYSENPVIDKQLNITGAGRGVVVNGVITMDTGSDDSFLQLFKSNGLTINSDVTEVTAINWWNAGSEDDVIDDGEGNFLQWMQE